MDPSQQKLQQQLEAQKTRKQLKRMMDAGLNPQLVAEIIGVTPLEIQLCIENNKASFDTGQSIAINDLFMTFDALTVDAPERGFAAPGLSVTDAEAWLGEEITARQFLPEGHPELEELLEATDQTPGPRWRWVLLDPLAVLAEAIWLRLSRETAA